MASYRTYVLIVIIPLVHALTAQEVVKRVPHGFFGMRGKKYMDARDSEMFKRRPNFFVGVKGKRGFEYPDFWQYKRAPMGFVGMRGKKEVEYDIEHLTQDEEVNEAINDYLQRLQIQDNDSSEVDKRAFYGVRGKRFMQKRENRPRGFIGVRGKKDVKYAGPKEIKFLLDSPWPKRKAQTGFLGMRGKKWLNDDSQGELVPN
ncbi:tachykinins [Pieris brassicae]|uniref:tachykinins n=1 Tax=Pieris brassicae TaxID=7116 RepID=UPI001E660A2A|nr:tachykinins [Pieris brassicae]XP_045525617.1 tachykinins [Pieris brassicae]